MFKLMLVRFDRDRGEFDDGEFNRLCQGNNILRIDKEFINADGNISLSITSIRERSTAPRPSQGPDTRVSQEKA